MVGLSYVGVAPVAPTDITNQTATNSIIDAITPNQETVGAQVASTVSSTYATLAQVNAINATFESPAYLTAQDLLNVPLTAKGTINEVASVYTPLDGPSGAYGVATLGSTGRVPAAQFPISGAPYIWGPWGPTVTTSATDVGETPIRIADWHLGTAGTMVNYQFQVWVFFSALVTATMDQPRIEIRIADSATAPVYSTEPTVTPLVAAGNGRYLYNDLHVVNATPAPNILGETPSLLPTDYELWATAWLIGLYSANGGGGVSFDDADIATAALYVVRGAE